MQIILTDSAKDKKVAFAGRALPLYLRTEEDLKKLAIIAHESQDPSILRLFGQLPTLAELRADKVASELPELPPDPEPEPIVTVLKKKNAKRRKKQD